MHRAWDKLSFDCAPSIDFIGFFLDTSKANGKVRHPGLLYKLERNGVKEKLLDLLTNYLHERVQIVLNSIK